MTEKEMLQRVLQDMMVLKKIILDHINGSKAPEADKEIMSLEECAEHSNPLHTGGILLAWRKKKYCQICL